MSTSDVIGPILRATYGKGAMADALIGHLAAKLDAGDYGRYAGREDMVVAVCWDWMTGGATAEAVAKQIERALTEHAASPDTPRPRGRGGKQDAMSDAARDTAIGQMYRNTIDWLATHPHDYASLASGPRHAAGVCPACNRTFSQLVAHMESQPPDYDPERA